MVDLQSSRTGEQLEAETFWIDIKTFMEKFYCTTICQWVPDYGYCHLADTHSSDGHGVTRLRVVNDITSKVVFTLHQLHRRFLDGWIQGTFEYAAMQLYLAKVEIQKRARQKPVNVYDDYYDESEEIVEETVMLLDGDRSVDQ